MYELLNLRISDNRNICILSENTDKTFYMFDEIIIKYNVNNNSIVLFEDFLCEGIKSFNKVLNKVFLNQLELDSKLREKGIGYSWNVYCDMLYKDIDVEDNTSRYHMWSTSSKYSNETWMYNMDNKIYIEVSQTYKWFNRSPYEDKDYISFNDYINKYEIYDTTLIESSAIVKWIQKTKEIINNMEI